MERFTSYCVFSFFRKERGLSLVELVVVMGIVILLSGLVMLNWRFGAREPQVRRQAQLVALDLRRAQNLALSSVQFAGQAPCGYGVYFSSAVSEKNRYILFADLNDNFQYDTSPTDETVDRIFLEAGLEILSLTPVSPLTIFFYPPNPNMVINTSSTNCNGASANLNGRVTIAFTDNPLKTKAVRVTTAGLIGVE